MLHGFVLGLPGRTPLPTVNSTSITIQWNTPDEVGDGITGYNVRWQENGTSTVQQKVITGSRVVRLDSLTPYTWYNIQVQAYSKKGSGPWSLVLKVRSAESGKCAKFVINNCTLLSGDNN